jgi:2-amino-4-hydroxy-6-hydroxymethyldihydropteridine diphosphokinase
MMKNNSNVIPYRLKFLQSGRTCGSNRLLLALGANISGAWGQPKDTLLRSLRELSGAGLPPLCCSPFFRTRPLGTRPQPDFLNAVVLTQATWAPAQLLRLVKGLERRAGRRLGPAWGPRPLDIDIVDYGGRRLGWPPPPQRRGRLILPHPEAHRRAFVLAPLAHVAPRWRHPVFGATARTLLGRLGWKDRHDLAPSP